MTTASLRYFSLGNKWWSWKDRVSMQILTASKYSFQRRSIKEANNSFSEIYFSLETGGGPERTEFWTFWNEAMRYIESCHNSSRDASSQFPSATVVTLVNCDKIQRTSPLPKELLGRAMRKAACFITLTWCWCRQMALWRPLPFEWGCMQMSGLKTPSVL